MKTSGLLLLVTGLLCWTAGLVLASPPDSIVASPYHQEVAETGEDYCTVCHTGNEQTFQLADGTVLPVAVDTDILDASVHGSGNAEGALACTDCHDEVEFPHVNPLPETDRAHTVSLSLNCVECHTDQVEKLTGDVHYEALANGNLRSATCVDCHGAHDVQPVDAEPATTSLMCATCHVTSFSDYEHSIHGEALLSGDPNVPGCVDCHNAHNTERPTTAAFRNESPELCATCHANEDLMNEYGISTNVFNSYLDDFHGQTVELFRQVDPGTPTNKAVCYDCHGAHNITPADDAKSQVAKENLLITCQQCHPGATSDFPASWVGHFEPSLASYPLLFGVRWFYYLVIPTTLLVFLGLIGSDIFHRVRRRPGKEN